MASIKIKSEPIKQRNTQDMKCVGIWYMEAIRKLKETNFTPERTIHVIWVPDEEIGGHDGMEKLIETDFFKVLSNIKIAKC